MKKQGRKFSENRLCKQARELLTQLGDSNAKRIILDSFETLIEELHIRQIELEAQNEEIQKAQTKLEEQYIKYADLYDLAPMGYFTFDKNGHIMEVNLAGAQLLGVERHTLKNNSFLHFLTSESRPLFHSHCQKTFETKTKQTCEIKLLKKDGTVFYGLMESIATQDNQCQSAINDITKLKQMEEKLQESHRILLAIMEYVPEGITVADAPDVTIRMVSTYGVRLIGRPRETLENIPAQDHVKNYAIFHSDGITPAAPDELPLTRAIRKGEVVINEEWIIRRPDEEEITILCNAGPIKGQNDIITGGIITWRDITERKQIEETLRKHRDYLEDLVHTRTMELKTLNDRYRLLLENLPQRIFYKDRNLTYISCNKNFARDFHIEPSEVTGKTDYDLFPREFAEKYRIDDKTVMKSGQTINIEEKYIKDGQELIVNTVKTPVRDEKGNIIGILGSSLDITEKINLKVETERSRHLALIGELAAGVAHEINNPISGVINYAQILWNKSIEGSREKDLASRIIKEGSRIATIVHNLLSFARPKKEEKSAVDIHEILSDSLSLTGTQLRKDGIKIKLDIPKNLPEITAYPQQIQQVFLNIISNARYALNQKYPGAHDSKILEILGETTTVNAHPYVKITFHDHGTGIPAKIKNKVMNPFFTTKPSGKGTGLGLSISHNIINDHGGRLIIESTEGEFTKVIILLPVK